VSKKREPVPSFPRPLADVIAGDNDLRHAIACLELLVGDDERHETIRRALLESACISSRRLFQSGTSLDAEMVRLVKVDLGDIPAFPDADTPDHLRYLVEYANRVVAHRVQEHTLAGPPPIWDVDRTEAVLNAVRVLASMNRHPSASTSGSLPARQRSRTAERT